MLSLRHEIKLLLLRTMAEKEGEGQSQIVSFFFFLYYLMLQRRESALRIPFSPHKPTAGSQSRPFSFPFFSSSLLYTVNDTYAYVGR